MKSWQKENIIWAMNSAVVIIYTVIFVLFANIPETIIPGIIFSTMMLILLCCVVFCEEKKRKGLLTVMAIIAAGLAVMSRRWWSGTIVLPVTACFSSYEYLLTKNKKNILINILLIWGFAFYGIRFNEDWRNMIWNTGILIAVVLVVIAVIWSLIVYYLNRYREMKDHLEQALKYSALDAMNERQLRMEIAETKNLAEENARLEERERISRDIHNSVGHTLSAATVTLDAAQMLMDSDLDKANQKIDQANERIHEAIGSVRSVVRTLDAEDDNIFVCDYVNSLKELLNNFSLDTEIKIHHNLDIIKDDGKIKLSRAAFISSAISELLTNGVKHGNATVFVVLVTLDQAHIGIQVSDNGTGWGNISFEQKQRKLKDGFGLRKMENHVKENAGNIEIDGDEGFSVKISLPR